MNGESWKQIAGFGNAYSVSDLGNVMRTSPRNIYRNPTQSRAKPFAPSPIRANINRDGYPQVRIGLTGHQMVVCVHRLVAMAWLPNPGNLRDVNHIDGNKANNRLNNLEWVSHQDNMKHCIENGLQKIYLGEESGNAKLTPADIVSIRSDTRQQWRIAADYGIDQTNVSQIKLRKTWSHVP